MPYVIHRAMANTSRPGRLGGTPPSVQWASNASPSYLAFVVTPASGTPWAAGNNLFLWRSDLPSGTPVAQRTLASSEVSQGYAVIADTTAAASGNPSGYTWWASVTTPTYSDRSGSSAQISGSTLPNTGDGGAGAGGGGGGLFAVLPWWGWLAIGLGGVYAVRRMGGRRSIAPVSGSGI